MGGFAGDRGAVRAAGAAGGILVWFGLVWPAVGLWPHRLKVFEGLRHGSAKKLYPRSYLSLADGTWVRPMPYSLPQGLVRSRNQSADLSLALRLSNCWTNLSVVGGGRGCIGVGGGTCWAALWGPVCGAGVCGEKKGRLCQPSSLGVAGQFLVPMGLVLGG